MTAKRKTHPSSKSVDWDELEDALATTKRGPVRDRVSAALDELFDEEERRDLTRLADHARRVRSRNPLIGNIVFLHGITGADLAVVDAAGDSDEIWVNIPRLILGRIQRLQLDAAARREADPKFTVQVAGINKKYYAHGVLALRARWNVETYAYDWRKDIDEASDGLATLIRQKFPGKPVHLVAHSMGGLVSRNLIRRHPQLWDAMKAPDLVAGGRLIMLGTPNYGSFAIPPVLTGGDQMMELLERIDLAHNMPELLAITNTFLGSYMLLPAPSKLSSMLQTLYQRDTWGNAPGISQAHLDRTYQFYHDLDASQTIDPDRMVYVAGSRRATFTEMTIVAPGEFEYKLSYDGDGRVPHALGLLPGVVTYYVDEVHGDLARNEQVLHAVDELLETGRTQELGTTVLRHLDRAAPTMRDYRTAADRRLMEELEQIARKAKAGGGPETLTAEERRIGAGAIVKAALGTSSRSLPKALLTASEGASARKRVPAIERIDLEVGVRFTDITKVKAPVVVVGHYRGVQPVNAIGAIDAALGGWISRALKQGMISGSLGETFFVPTFGAIAARGAVVAGMGDYGRFGPSDLRLLLANVAIGAGAMKLPSIASVLVGGGQGSMDRDTALREFLEGIGTGLQQLLEEGVVNAATLKRLEFVERHPGRFFDLVQKIDALAQAGSLSTVRIKARKPDPADVRRARAEDQRERHKSTSRAALSAVVGAFEEVRVTVESGPTDGAYRFSALTRSAVVPVRDLTIHQHYAVGAANALREARTRDEQEKFGRLLYTYLMPEDFHEYIDNSHPVRLVVDRGTAAFPWEMGCFPARTGQGGIRWLGTDLRLSRQFRTLLSRAPGMSPPLNDRLRVLVIADPAPEHELQLKGARAEGRRVIEILKAANGKPADGDAGGAPLDIEVEQRIGSAECDPVEILALLLCGDFDIVHYAGHGDYDPANPDSTGWIFGRDNVLTARDIFRARKVPRLVFANACFSGVLREGRAFAEDELTRGLATIAQAFFERGVPNYIGSGWPVDDAQALTMAEQFYMALVQRRSIGDALYQARKAIFDQQIESTWGAYQHYGDPDDTLLRPPG